MVYIPRINFKSGINPSILAWFPTNGQYSGTQKLMLTRTRIFGDKISGNLRSGIKPWRSVHPARFQFLYTDKLQLHDYKRELPMLRNQQTQQTQIEMKNRKQQKRLIKQAKKAAKDSKKKK